MIAPNNTMSLLADESAQTAFPVEWWFVQGRFEGEGVEPREFMISLFRHSLEWKGLKMGNACSFIFTSLNPATGINATRSIVDPGTTAFVAKASRHYPPPGLDPGMIAVVADELSEFGPPHPIETEPRKPKFGKNPLRIEWGDFLLDQNQESISLTFTEAGSDRDCRFRITPRHPRMHLPHVDVPDGGAMDYVSYTRMDLEGRVDGKPVTGTAWFDHQWGSQGWVVGGENHESMLGWDWLGIQLKDGRDLLIMAHRDMRDRSLLKQYAILINPNGSNRIYTDIELTPTAWWHSPTTSTDYPVKWDVRIPELQLKLHFEPMVNNQEIPMLPPMRAVWEGAGSVTGTMQSEAVTGWARLELHGYAYIVNAESHLSRIIGRVSEQMESYLPREFTRKHMDALWKGETGDFDPADMTAMISRPLWEMWDLDRSELWYPLTGNLMIAALGKDPEPFEKLTAVTANMMLGGAKILDDIQDNAVTRNGRPTIHEVYGVKTAILAGSMALMMPMDVVLELPGLSEGQSLELMRLFNRCCLRAQIGQAQDLRWSGNLTQEFLTAPRLEERILQGYKGKDGIFTEAAMEGAAIIAEAGQQTRAACFSFGTALGLALGIRNDVGDFSPQNITDGSAGADLSEGKASFVIARAVSLSKGAAKQELIDLCCDREARRDPAALKNGIDLILESGALESSLETARSIMQDAWSELSRYLPPSESKTMLRVLWSLSLAPLEETSGTAFISKVSSS